MSSELDKIRNLTLFQKWVLLRFHQAQNTPIVDANLITGCCITAMNEDFNKQTGLSELEALETWGYIRNTGNPQPNFEEGFGQQFSSTIDGVIFAKKLMKPVLDAMKKAEFAENSKFIGFNQLEFDLPFFNARLYELKIDNLPKIWERVNRHLAWIDLRQLLGESVGHFHEWRKHFTGKSYGMSGKMIPIFYEKGEYTKIEEYIGDELEGFEDVFNVIKKEPFYLELQKLRDKLLK